MATTVVRDRCAAVLGVLYGVFLFRPNLVVDFAVGQVAIVEDVLQVLQQLTPPRKQQQHAHKVQ